VSRFGIKGAMRALQRLVRRLEETDDPGAPFERSKAVRVIRELESVT
jgi:hypothetical protein